MRKRRPNVRDVAAAIVQRAPQGHIVQLSEAPTLEQRLHLIAARIDGRPLVVLSGKLASMDRPVAASPR
jgi:hypothetical protein